jgi:uncharacterized protein YbjQ (UPF0145 family)
MFLTTETSIPQSHTVLRVIFGVGSIYEGSNKDAKASEAWRKIIGQALAELEREGMQLGADAVIGVQVSTSETGAYLHATMIGTAVKF